MNFDEVSVAGEVGADRGASEEVEPRMIAPWWHTVLVVVQLGTLAAIGSRGSQSRVGMPHVVVYTVAVMSTWLQLGAVVAGIYRRREFFFDTLLSRAGSVGKDVWHGIALYLGTALVLGIVVTVMHRSGVQHGFDNRVLMEMAPNSVIELLMWLGVSASVGFCEEHVFRGYLLQQVVGWMAKAGASGRLGAGAAVVGTSVLFGSLHLYEGIGGALLITLLGVIYATVALRLGNLRVVIVAHVLQDFLAFVLLMLRHAHGTR